MPDSPSIISVVASVVSATGGLFACIAAYKSAHHVEEAHKESLKAEKRIALKQLSFTAQQVIAEVDRAKWVAQGLKVANGSLACFMGQFGRSKQKVGDKEVDKKITEADNLSQKANPFTQFQEKLMEGPLDEITSREVKISMWLLEARALREKLEIELSSIEAQNASCRDKILQTNQK